MAKVNDICIGCGACVAIAPEVFELNDDGVAEVVGEVEGYEDIAAEAAASCPVEAIEL